MTEEGETATNGPASLRPDGSAIRNPISLSGRRPGELSTGNTPERCFAHHAQLWPRLVAMVQPSPGRMVRKAPTPTHFHYISFRRPGRKQKRHYSLFSPIDASGIVAAPLRTRLGGSWLLIHRH